MLSDLEYQAALADLAEYERRIAESDRLAQRDSLRVAATLASLQADSRWIEEWNAQRAESGKTARSRKPVDHENRSQFSTWVRQHYKRIDPRNTYRLLDAHMIRTSFIANGNKTPTAEAQLRPLKSLLSMANGQGARIPEVWDIACKLAADAGRDQPTSEDVKHGIAEWRRLHLPAAQAKQERSEDRAWIKERKAVAAWKELLSVGGSEQINAFIDVIRADIEQLEASKA